MALSVFVVLCSAKIAMLAGRDVQFGPLVFADDALIAAGFAFVEWLARKRRWIVIALYIALVGYAAVNVPLARLTSSPLTVQMFRATGSALSDSIAHHLTAVNVALIFILGVVATGLPFGMIRAPSRVRTSLLVLVILLTALGCCFPHRMSISRNAFSTLARSAWPHVQAHTLHEDWRVPIASQSGAATDLEFLRGSANGRNIVIISLESTGAQYLRPYGAANDPMPNLTTLTESSLLFENAYAVYPESIKGLFSVLCSRYPAFDTEAANYAGVRTPAIAAVARCKGYRTALFHSGRFMYLGMRDIIGNRGFELLEDAGHIGGNHESSFGVDEPSAVRRILQWVESLDDGERFCVMYLPIAGHHPYEVPGEAGSSDGSERSRYLNALRYSDAALGQLVDGLKEHGVYTNTLFVIYGDHGEAFGQHAGNFGHTFFLYEENVRVPLIIAAPGLISAPIRSDSIASLVDVTPTIADLAGFAMDGGWQGTSLLRAESRAAIFFTDYGLPLVGIRDGPWKFVCEINGNGRQLFDASRDAAESMDLSGKHPAMVAQYRERLSRWAAAQKALLKP
jgi:phosphoglycerol transferase MdoB-like AlkP superfamily enzyme